MHPILFKVGSFKLYTYGLMMALGVLAGLFTVTSEAKRYKWNVDLMTRLVVWVFLMGLIGARFVYVLTRLSDPHLDLLYTIFNLRAGFVYYGGLIGAWLFLVWYIRRHKLPMWPVFDSFAMAVCIGIAVGRIGCLMGGCCYGIPTTLPWGVIMVAHPELGHLHPVQAYESITLFSLFTALWIRRKEKAYEGELTVWFVGVYAIARYILEFFRGDLIRGFIIPNVLSTSQFISIPMLILAIVLHFKLRKKKKAVQSA